MIERTSKGWEHGPPYYVRRFRAIMARLSLMAVMAIVLTLAAGSIGDRAGRWSLLASSGWLALYIAAFPVLLLRLRRRIRREFDAASGRLCTHCAYNLKDLPPRGGCPECGHEYDAEFDAKTWAGAGFVVTQPPESPPLPTEE